MTHRKSHNPYNPLHLFLGSIHHVLKENTIESITRKMYGIPTPFYVLSYYTFSTGTLTTAFRSLHLPPSPWQSGR